MSNGEKVVGVELAKAAFEEAYALLIRGAIGTEGMFNAGYSAAANSIWNASSVEIKSFDLAQASAIVALNYENGRLNEQLIETGTLALKRSHELEDQIAALKEQLAAARNDALEEAAKAAENAECDWQDEGKGLDIAAAAIRALASQPAAPVQPEDERANLRVVHLGNGNGTITSWTTVAPPVQQPGDVRFHNVWNDALEEAALICDRQAREPECPERAEYCADEIRALKALATARPSAALTDEVLRKARNLTLDYIAAHFDGQSITSPSAVIEFLESLKDAPLDSSAILAASSGAVAVPEVAITGKDSGCRMQGGICACRSGGSYGGCVRERESCCAAAPATPAQGQTK